MLNLPGESDLLKAAQRGDRVAFDRLVKRHRDFIVGVCGRYFGANQADREDAVQETCIRAFRAISAFQGDSHVETWLFSIARNVCLDILKRNARQETGTDHAVVETIVPSVEEKYMAQHCATEQLQALRNLLSPNDYQILIFKCQFDMTSDEIAYQLGMTAVNVRKRLNTAIKEAIRRVMQSGDTG